jgi:hypothetical protein
MDIKITRHGDYEKIVVFPIFADYKVRIVVTDDLQKSWDARIHDAYDAADTEALFGACDSGSALFFHREATVGTIAHESWHAIRYMLLESGAELDNEVVAYHLAYLVDRAFDFVWCVPALVNRR